MQFFSRTTREHDVNDGSNSIWQQFQLALEIDTLLDNIVEEKHASRVYSVLTDINSVELYKSSTFTKQIICSYTALNMHNRL